jgi:hypothetical protein
MSAMGMEINWMKSCVHYSFPKEDLTPLLKSTLSFPRKSLDEGFKYLKFNLKPNAYGFEDWLWLYKKLKLIFHCGSTDGCLEEEG